jgi:long-chain fatty acid transport protein
MKRTSSYAALGILLLALAPESKATNGDELIGVGATSRSLGGVGVAAPQDAITAITANPAALGFGPDILGLQAEAPINTEPNDGKSGKSAKAIAPVNTPQGFTNDLDLSASFFTPHLKAEANGVKADGHEKTYVVPEIAWSTLLDGPNGHWGLGVAVYGGAGLGVDYRNTSLDNPRGYNFSGTKAGPFAPLVAGGYTQFQALTVAPALAYRINSQWSLGIAGHFNYETLDLNSGKTHDWSFGFEPGITFRPVENVSLGLAYTSEQKADFKNVTDFNGDGRPDSLKLAQPQQVAFGIAAKVTSRLLLEANVKWIDWSNADGYGDFGWKDEWVAGIGAQYELIPEKLAVRLGYDFGTNPVNGDNGWNGAYSPKNTTNVQGKQVPNYYYESFRTIGFPAIVENHLTFGVGYNITRQFAVNLGWVHAYDNTSASNGTNLYGQPTSLKSTLSEDSIELGVRYRF